MRKLLLAVLFLFSFNTLAFAQQVETITLDEAVDIALENNFRLAVEENFLELADDRITGEKADYFPSLNANFNARRSVGNQFIPGTSEFTQDAFRSFSGSLGSSIVLFSGFANIRSLRNAQYAKRSQAQNVEWTRETIIFQTATRFLQVLLNRELLEIAQENLDASIQTLEQVEIQTDVGSRPIVDLYNQQAAVANNRLLVTNRENELELSRLALVRTLQIDPLQNYRFVIPDVNIEAVAMREYNLPQLVAVALENRSDLQSAEYNIQALKYQLGVARSRYYPTLSFGGSISSRYIPDFVNRFTGESLSFSEQFFDFQISRGFGFSLSIPIFNNLSIRTNVQAAKINYQNAQLNLEDTRLQVIQEVKQAYADYQAILERLQATQVALRAAQKAYEAEQARYEVGAGTLIQLTQANANFVEAQANRAQAVFNFIFQEKLLSYYLGKLDSNISFN